MPVGKAKKQLLESFSRTTDEIFSLKEFEELLDSKKKIRIKYGVDVTSPYLHIGHAVNLWMMRELQDLGHKVLFLIGDFTGMIGDPSGKSAVRKKMTKKDIAKNAATYKKQIFKILDKPVKIAHQQIDSPIPIQVTKLRCKHLPHILI